MSKSEPKTFKSRIMEKGRGNLGNFIKIASAENLDRDTQITPQGPFNDFINNITKYARQNAYDLIVCLTRYKREKNQHLRIATSESLTAGLIMSTLVDIPLFGEYKYGGYIVYDTDAKHKLNGLSKNDLTYNYLYSHQCSKAMAFNLLQNSNASIAIAVSGNAMPRTENTKDLGIVYLTIAGFDKNGNIIFINHKIDVCESISLFKLTLCKEWQESQENDEFNKVSDTATLSIAIRYYTAIISYSLCKDFIDEYNPVPNPENADSTMITSSSSDVTDLMKTNITEINTHIKDLLKNIMMRKIVDKLNITTPKPKKPSRRSRLRHRLASSLAASRRIASRRLPRLASRIAASRRTPPRITFHPASAVQSVGGKKKKSKKIRKSKKKNEKKSRIRQFLNKRN